MSNPEISNSLIALLIDRIAASPQQRLTFAEYMDLILYHPQYGYYTSQVAIGSDGDFFTSSSLGKDFGELLAEQFIETWQILGQPKPFSIVEMGAGTGRFTADVLTYLVQKYPSILDSLQYLIIERSPGLIAQQKAFLEPFTDINIAWKTWQDILPSSLVGCLFSNELVDAFPVRRIAIENNRLKEIYVTYRDRQFIEVSDEISTPKIADYFNLVGVSLPSKEYPENYQSEVNLAALEWLDTIASKLQRGYLFTIDYGYNAQKYYHPQRYCGTLQCYYQHRRHNNPYINIGNQDISAHVDFTALERQGERNQLSRLGFTQQGIFLMALGLGDRLSELSSGKYNLSEILKRRDALHQLIDPTGLGGFGVLVQTKGLSETEKARSLKGLKQPEGF
jgi:SAM-dependent MidA family methyltransferase